MCNWYLLTHNSNYGQSLTSAIEKLGVEVYSPCLTTFFKRRDRPSLGKTEKVMFPGYLLLNFDPYTVHTTKIAALNGAHGFVRFGGEACVVQDCVVEELRSTLLLRAGRNIDCVEFRNLPSELTKSLHLIIDMTSQARRKTAFFALLEQAALCARLASRPGARIYSALNTL